MTCGWTNCTSDQPVAKAPTYTGEHNTETQTSMLRAGFEPSSQAVETHASDRAATGRSFKTNFLISM
jgi:hypothetical protein